MGGGGKQRAIHNLCSTLESSCLANVKHCLGLFWALYFYKGCFELGEGCKGGFLIASTLKNKILGRKIQEPSLVMWLIPHPIGESLEALRQAGLWRKSLASLVIGDLLEELKPFGIQGEHVAHAVDMQVPSLQGGPAPHAAQPQEDSGVKNHQLLNVPSKESHKYHLIYHLFHKYHRLLDVFHCCPSKPPRALRLLHFQQSRDPEPRYYTRRSRTS